VDLIESEKGYVEQLGLVIRVSVIRCRLGGSPFSDSVSHDSSLTHRAESRCRLVAERFPSSKIGYHV